MKYRHILLLAALLAGGTTLNASSHREAPAITGTPKLDCTDFYIFRSYETGRQDFVTIVANYIPLEDPYGGPNYFPLDPDALYEIHVDNNGDAVEDITFQFRASSARQDITLNIGPAGNQKTVAIPLINAGPVSAGSTAALNVQESYTFKVIRGPRRTGTVQNVIESGSANASFKKPADYIGTKSIPDYKAYAAAHIYNVDLPGGAAGAAGKVFVGQRKDPFVVNLGETFDLVNLNPLGPVDGARDSLANKNVTSFVLEVPISYLITDSEHPVIGAWATASRNAGGTPVQVSRLSNPLVNEVVIGLKDKDNFNASEPKNDGQFADYVTHPVLPVLLQSLFGVTAPTAYPRADLVQVFLTGVPTLNVNGSTAEMIRLNTGIAPKSKATQNNLGVLGGDTAGFPNGRRPGDDVVDMALRVVMGVLLPAAEAPSGQLPYTDGATVNASFFDDTFPYLKTPVPGSPNSSALYIYLEASATLENFLPFPATYDPVTKELITSLGSARQYFRARTDGPLKFGDPKVAGSTFRIPLAKP
ncbi:MAG TPA: DUF4331 domain-containing protein [Verrucomicrobiales bacterium]|nr:DUF4331 domain-containing protein [Verrucomicrobiales bacterium]